MITKTQSLQNQIRINLFRILGTYFFTISLVLVVLGFYGITHYQKNQLNQNQVLISTKITSEVTSALREASSLASSSLVWTGMTDSAGRDAYLEPLLYRINVTNPYKVDLLDYKGRDFIVTDSFLPGKRQLLNSVKNTVNSDQLHYELLSDQTTTNLVVSMPIKAPFSESSLGILLIKINLEDILKSLSLNPDLAVEFDDASFSDIQSFDFLTKASLQKKINISAAEHRLSFTVRMSKPLKEEILGLFIAIAVLIVGAFFVLVSLRKWSFNFAEQTTHRLNELVAIASNAARGEESYLERRSVIDEIDQVIDSLQEIFNQQRISNEKILISSKVFETAAEAILITDNEGVIIDINDSLLEITGFTKKDLIGKSAGLLYRDSEDHDSARIIAGALKQAGYWKGETVFKTKNGRRIPTLASITSLIDKKGERKGTVAIFADISEIKLFQEKLKQQLYIDNLTGLQNFRAFTEFIELRVRSESLKPFIILFIDLDNFKGINDTYGHNQGDQAIIQMAEHLKNNLPSSAKLFRRSGDEFIAYVDVVDSIEATKSKLSGVLHKIVITLGAEIKNTFSCTFSAGGAVYPNNNLDLDQLLVYADTALHYSKEVGRERTTWFDDSVKAKIERKKALEIKLVKAIEKNLLFLNYQPEVLIKDGEIVGFEALARWVDDELGMISPAEFIPLAEERGLIDSLTNSFLKKLNQDLELIIGKFPNVKISFNASPKLFKDLTLYRILNNRFGDSIHKDKLVLEITESEEIQSSDVAINQLKCIIQMGIQVAIDDFGKGFSSLSRLSAMPIHKLKIDSSFLFDYKSNNGKKIIESIISLSESLKLDITAEGVECKEQADLLVSLGCRKAQGYFYSKPIDISDVQKLDSHITKL